MRFIYSPATGAATYTLTSHERPGRSRPPATVTDEEPTVAVSVPPQVFVWTPMATDIAPGDAGRTSTNATGVAMTRFGLVTVMVSSEAPPATMVSGAKILATVTWLTINVSVAGGAVPLSVTRAPVVFKWSPGTDEVTLAV